MRTKFKYIVLSFSLCILACGVKKDETRHVTTKVKNTEVVFTAAMVDNKKDPSCGMPVTAGIKDTVHYGGKVYGFCSDECKQAFLKDPVAMAKQAEMK